MQRGDVVMSKRVARLGIFVALAMVFSYIEVIIPFSFGIPGVKLGIANIVVVTGLYFLKPQDVFLISLVRICLMGMLFGNGASLLYSLAGGILSFLAMLACKRFRLFTIIGISVVGGVTHNLGQLLAAAAVLQNRKIFYYFPILLAAGVVTGAMIGFLAKRIVRAMKAQEYKME